MPSNAQYAALTAAGLVGTYGLCKVFQHLNKNRLPKTWKAVGTIDTIYTFPIKSCGPVVLQEAECTFMGLKDCWLRDRVLMVINENNKFITARDYPNMLLIHPTIKGSVLTLKYRDMEPVSVNLAEVASTKQIFTSNVWDTPVPTYDCGREINEWLSRVILQASTGVRLVYYASQDCRPIRNKPTSKYYKFYSTDTGALPDETAFNLVNDASVDELNTRLESKVNALYFRPNFVMKGGIPLDEDNWKYIKIGDNVFEIVKPCLRCVLTTIDPETGIKNPKAEPLKTLRSYRQVENEEIRKMSSYSPRMGVQMALRSAPGGFIRTNDTVFVA